MRPRGLLLWPLACVVPLACVPARAADDDPAADGSPAPATTPLFSELRTGYNGIESSRMPTELQPLREPGNRALIPPRADRDPLQARVSVALEADDNLFLATDHRRKGAALVVIPGLDWKQEGPRYRIELDASAEFLKGVAGDYDASRLDASTLLASALLRSSETTSINYFGTLLRSHDPAGNTLSTPVAGDTADQRYASSYQRHELGFAWRTSPRTDISARWAGVWADSRIPDYVRTRSDDFDLGGHWQLDPALRLGASLRERRAAYAGHPDARYAAAWLEAERLWSPTLIGRAAIGVAQGDGPTLALLRASMTQTFSAGQWDLALERDVSAPAGLGRLYEMRGVRVGTAFRVGQRGHLEIALLASEYRPLGATAGDSGSVRTVRPRLVYTLALSAHTWISVRYQGIDDHVIDTTLRRQGDRLLVTLLQTF